MEFIIDNRESLKDFYKEKNLSYTLCSFRMKKKKRKKKQVL